MPNSTKPSFGEALRFWWRLGWISFGGPAGQIAILHRELVDRKGWVEEKQFLHALNYCLMLPGPEAQQLATFLGWRLHGIRGGLCAGILFVLPSIFILWILSVIYVWYGSVPLVASAFYGLAPAVIALVFHAMLRLGRKTLNNPMHWIIALAAAVVISIYRESYPLIVLGAGLAGWLFRRQMRGLFTETETLPDQKPVHLGRQVWIGSICLVAWLAPLLVAGWLLGWRHTVTQEGIFFSKAALVTFGGAYAVLPYVAQNAVKHYHWLRPEQMLHGFGLAETTPGPLIMVLQFVGFMGAWNQPGRLAPLTAATLGSLLTTWVTFAPCFLFILAGAPFVERLITIKSLQVAMGAISAAVVGVIANFAFWFAWQVIFPAQTLARPDFFAAFVCTGGLAALHFWKADVVVLIGICALLGMIWRVVL
ncbi:MAG TPA: chromate efflux transporter [Candidatus Methylacidiphilales bacterium]|nr:chromate efflux transporter [Candidatus Methylacidiphilales bacterium]